MHRRILEDTTDSQLREFVIEFIDNIDNNSLYTKIEELLYLKTYGYHFTSWNLPQGNWSIEQSNQLLKQFNYEVKNNYDFNYSLNTVYKEYKGVVSDNIELYFKLAKRFIENKNGEVYRYYLAMKCLM